MLQTKILPEENNHQSENEYLPPEKKSREFEEILEEAIECCKNREMGIEEASLIYGVAKSTLKANLNDSCSTIDENLRVFILSVYPAEAESDLVRCLQDLISSQIIMTAIDVRRLAYELFCEKYKMTSLPKGRNCVLGQRWYRSFIQKYLNIEYQTQFLIVNEKKSSSFYTCLEKALNNFKIGSGQIYAVDGVDLKFRASCVDYVKIYHNRRTMYANAKAICCISPVGDFVPPVFMNFNHLSLKKDKHGLGCLEGKDLQLDKVYDNLKEVDNIKIKNIPTSEDLLYIEKQIKMHLNKKHHPMSKESEEELKVKLYNQFVQLKNKIITECEHPLNEITPEIFHDWFLSFLSHVKPNPQKACLLLVPDQNWIKSYKILELGKKNNVKFLVLPSHAYHKIYPLDGFAMSLNRNLSTCARRWLGKNPDFKVQQIPLHVLFREAFNETVNPLIARNGFLYSGIWPINRDIFQSTELGGDGVLVINKSKSPVSESCTADDKRNDLSSYGVTSEADLKKVCRICTKEKIYMKPLLETVPSKEPNYYGKKINEISKVTISDDNGLPYLICQYCLVELMDVIKIKEKIIDSHEKQRKLREALDKFYFEDEESENQDLLYLFPRATRHSKMRSGLTLKDFDINSICRICMEAKCLMTSIFYSPQDSSSTLSTDTCSRIMEISDYEVHFHDGLSSSICPFCRMSIYKASDFIRRVVNSDKTLRDIITILRRRNS